MDRGEELSGAKPFWPWCTDLPSLLAAQRGPRWQGLPWHCGWGCRRRGSLLASNIPPAAELLKPGLHPYWGSCIPARASASLLGLLSLLHHTRGSDRAEQPCQCVGSYSTSIERRWCGLAGAKPSTARPGQELAGAPGHSTGHKLHFTGLTCSQRVNRSTCFSRSAPLHLNSDGRLIILVSDS